MPERVLLVDDDERLVSALRLRLEATGYEVHTACNGDIGASMAALLRPDAIVLDVRMPEMDGYEVCRLVRSVPELNGIPIIVLSAGVEDSTAQAVRSAGGDAFLCKPYDLRQLLAAMRQFIDGGRRGRLGGTQHAA